VVKSAVQYPTAIQSLPGMIHKNNRLRRVFSPPCGASVFCSRTCFVQQKTQLAICLRQMPHVRQISSKLDLLSLNRHFAMTQINSVLSRDRKNARYEPWKNGLDITRRFMLQSYRLK